MDLELALLSDAANISREGKLSVFGIFDTIYSSTFPMQVPQMQLVMRFKADPVEADRNYKIEIQLIDQDGKKLAALQAGMSFGDSPSRAKGVPLRGDHIVTFANVHFPKPGPYEFAVLINDEVRKKLSLYVQETAPKAA